MDVHSPFVESESHTWAFEASASSCSWRILAEPKKCELDKPAFSARITSKTTILCYSRVCTAEYHFEFRLFTVLSAGTSGIEPKSTVTRVRLVL